MTDQTLVRELAGFVYLADAVDIRYGWILKTMQRQGPALVTMRWRLLGNDQDAADVYQSTCLHLAHLESGRRPANTKAYLFKTAANIAISLLRSRCMERKAIEGAGQLVCRDDHDSSQCQQIDQAWLVQSSGPTSPGFPNTSGSSLYCGILQIYHMLR
ncbi:MAG: sigma-70 family RNA polymerase sigma factor [Sedimentisphaerales bacterium]|nr:sigma-70 family RNA polymerase sigma factor [Sedimentisphaerales bacterium]